MKNINEYLSSAIKDTKYLRDGFPTRPNYNEIVDFLQSEGFKLLNYNSQRSSLSAVIKYVTEHAEASNVPLLCITNKDYSTYTGDKDKYTWIRFCNYGEISKDNPIFLLRLFRDGDSCYQFGDIGPATIEVNDADRKEIKTYDEFVELVNNQFDW